MAQIGYLSTIRIGVGETPTWTKLAEVLDFTLPAGEADLIETTHMESPGRRKEFITGLRDSGSATIEMNYNPGSATDTLLIGIGDTGETVQIEYSINNPANTANPFVETWAGSLQNYERTAPVNDKLAATATFKISAKIVA